MVSVTVITADSRPEQETQHCLVLPAPAPLGADQPSAAASHGYLSMTLAKAAGEHHGGALIEIQAWRREIHGCAMQLTQ